MTNAVRMTSELARIVDLPRRDPTLDEATVDALTRVLKKPEGTMRLRITQALALAEIAALGGGFVPLEVGGGKTLISLLAPWVINCKRPLLILPASLIDKTDRDRDFLSKHWLIPTHMRVISFEMLSRKESAEYLEGGPASWVPDLVVVDECHKFKNPDASCTRKFLRFAANHPETRFVFLGGTPMDRSLLEFGHLLPLAVKGERCPIPRDANELAEWALALDEKVDEWRRYSPAALLCLAPECTCADGFEHMPDCPRFDTIKAARQGFQRRLVETPGVIASTGPGEHVKQSIYVRAVTYPMKSITDTHFETMRLGRHPVDEWDLEPVDVWRHARELALGYTNIWDPRPPDDWAEARREWFSFARKILGRSDHLDSPDHIASACDRGELDAKALNRWRAIKPTFTPNDVPVWHDDSAIEVAAKWMSKPGIVWVEHVAFGARLAEQTGRPYFREGARDASGRHIYDADGPIIASIDACRAGLNLQEKWSRNLYTSIQESPEVWQQSIGRTHRTGQRADEVTVDVMLGCLEHVKAWRALMAGAVAVQDMTGNTQKLLLADITWPTDEEIASFRGPRWAIPEIPKFTIPV